MCGIIGYIGTQDPKGILLDGLKRLEYRGYDSAGIAILEDREVKVFRCEGRLQKLEKILDTKTFKGRLGIGHTRWATHGAPTEDNAHPHRVGAITLVHNGIIENYMQHKQAILRMGRVLNSETDSEIVAHLFDIEVQKGSPLKEALKKVLPQLQGSYAFVILNEKEPDVMVGVRNGAPLLAAVAPDEYFVASDVQAVLHRTNRVIYLKDKEAIVCRRDGVELFDENGRAVTPVIQTINWTPDQMEKQGFRHYMLKEIHEQSQALAHTIENNIDHNEGIVRLPALSAVPGFLDGIDKISIVACGTARHAALVGKYYIERLADIPVDVDYGSEFRYRDPLLDDRTLLVLVSQSGETADTLAACREGRQKKIRTLCICNVRESTLTRESDVTLYTNAGPEIGVASTKAFTTQLAVLYMLAVEVGLKKGRLSKSDAASLTADLLKLPILTEKTLLIENIIETVATQESEKDFFFYMGRGVQYPIAQEGALKLKEISYIHSEGYAAGELKHGPIALIDRHTVLVVIAPKDVPYSFESAGALNRSARTVYEKLMSNLQEVKSRGGIIFTIGTEGDELFAGESKYFAGLPSASWALNPILMSIPVQLLAYHIAVRRGTDIDKPRNLAKSVTVE